ncbi:MAG TPA: alpha/beta hydrolase [Acidiferrobacteraceae bacterium]|nr:alpha/beta hydrolase [Acidiferrobacteraceae bacterium]
MILSPPVRDNDSRKGAEREGAHILFSCARCAVFVLFVFASFVLGGCQPTDPKPNLTHTPTDTWGAFVKRVDKLSGPDLYYETQGQGSPVLFVHAFANNLSTWADVRGPLSRDHKLWMLDLKGFGRSPKPDDGHYSIYDHAAQVIRFIRRHDLSQLTLVGHSMGGGVVLAVSLYLIEHEPDRIVRLVLIDSAAYPQSLPIFLKLLQLPLLPDLLGPVLSKKWLVRMLLQRLYYNDALIRDADVDTLAMAFAQPGASRALIQTGRQIRPKDHREISRRYTDITLPTVILWGREDIIVPIAMGERLHRAIKGSEFIILKGCGHMPQGECPQRTAAIIEKFLQQHEANELVRLNK